MSHHTQRATKYILSTVTQLSENLCSPRAAHTTTAWREVTPYVKPFFTAINTVAMILTRYAAVFPLTDDQLFSAACMRTMQRGPPARVPDGALLGRRASTG